AGRLPGEVALGPGVGRVVAGPGADDGLRAALLRDEAGVAARAVHAAGATGGREPALREDPLHLPRLDGTLALQLLREHRRVCRRSGGFPDHTALRVLVVAVAGVERG